MKRKERILSLAAGSDTIQSEKVSNSMDFGVIATLPECLASSILAEWLLLNDVGRLDTAFCFHELRDTFTKVAFNNTTVYQFDIDPYYYDQLDC